jgi:hypothetical protein
MKIWILDCELDEYENFDDVEDLSIDEINSFDGRNKLDNWKPIVVEKMDGDGELGNTPAFHSHIPVMDKKALEVLNDLLNYGVEVLPLEYNKKINKYFLINVTAVLNCINYKKSDYKTFDDGIRVMYFNKYVFIEDKLKGKHIFKIIDSPLSSVFVSDEFREKVIDSDLVGFKFELVWDSEV